MLASSDLIAFVSTTDMARSRAFYEEVLGLRLVSEDGFACVFDANGTMLRVTAAGEVAGAQYTVLGWRVPDIAAAVRGLYAHGVTFLRFGGMDQDDLGIWLTPGGDMVAWFKDPDSNTLSLTEFRSRS